MRTNEIGMRFAVARGEERSRSGPRCGSILLMLLLVLTAAVPALAQDVPFQVYLTELVEQGEIEPSPVDLGDWYAKVTINGDTMSNKSACSDTSVLGGRFRPWTVFSGFRRNRSYCPGATPWIFSKQVPQGQDVSVKIQVFDEDSISGDDEGDLKPGSGRSLNLVVDAQTGRWSGDVNWPQTCSRDRNDSGDNVARVCFQISFDTDGDGLLDVWERYGMDTDGDGVVDLPLDQFGADPMHKDLFVELDWMAGNEPGRDEVQEWKNAFALAPVDAGGRPNPDGEPGINLWVDTGSLQDAFGQPVGDDLGGGNAVPFANVSALNERFYQIRDANFDQRRELVFRYGLSAGSPINNMGTSTGDNTKRKLKDTSQDWIEDEWEKSRASVTITGGTGEGQRRKIDSNTDTELVVTSDWDPVPDETSTYRISLSGGWGEVGGNDFVEYNHTSSTLMHELGHNLYLRHGGRPLDDNGDKNTSNCKPNYVSVMNYDHDRIYRQTSFYSFIDYSPPRKLDGSRSGDVPDDLNEAMMNDAVVLDSDDPDTMFVFTTLGVCVGGADEGDSCALDSDCDAQNCVGEKRLRPMEDAAEWDDDTDTANASVAVNVDTSGVNSGGDVISASCANQDLDVLESHDDWSNIVLPFLQYGDAQASAIDMEGPEPTLEERRRLNEDLNTADLSISQSAPATVEVGDSFNVTLRIENGGPNPALAVEVLDLVPADTTLLSHSSSSGGCVEDPSGVLTCDLEAMLSGQDGDVSLLIGTDGRVCVNGVPQPLTNFANVANVAEHAGPDPDLSDNAGSIVVQAVDTTPPVIESLDSDTYVLWPPNHRMVPVSLTVEVRDLCDDGAACVIKEVTSDEPVNGRGDGNTSPDWEIVGDLDLELRAERSGRGDGRTYTIVVECSDASGNGATADVDVFVPHDMRQPLPLPMMRGTGTRQESLRGRFGR